MTNKLNLKTYPNNSQRIGFIELFGVVSRYASDVSESRGWYIPKDDPEKLGNKIALMHSELTEALEALRNGDQRSDHIPVFTGMEEEFADTIIRIMHFAERMNLRVAEAILAKIEFNATRPYKHGGKKF